MPELRDDLGHIYWESPRSHGSSVAVVAIPASPASQATPTPSVPTKTDTLVFPALSLSTSQATLWVDALEFYAPARATFTIDLGQDPQIGDAWPLDIHLNIAGFPVHFTGARLRQETNRMPNGKNETQTMLEFDLDPLPEEGGLGLSGFDLFSPGEGFNGSGSSGNLNGRYRPYLSLSQAGEIPSGRVQVQIPNASLLVRGPWEATWTIPGRNPASLVQPVRLLPAADNQAGGALHPVVGEAFLSDRLTALKLDAIGLPPGASFVQVLAHDPTDFAPQRGVVELYLEDNWGRRYEPGGNEAFIRPDGEDTG
jgi:hypothetical protein